MACDLLVSLWLDITWVMGEGITLSMWHRRSCSTGVECVLPFDMYVAILCRGSVKTHPVIYSPSIPRCEHG